MRSPDFRAAAAALLTEVVHACADLAPGVALMDAVGAKLGEFLDADECGFWHIEAGQPEHVLLSRWREDEHAARSWGPELASRVLSSVGEANEEDTVMVVRDTGSSGATLLEAPECARAFIAVPYGSAGNSKYVLTVASTEPREWHTEEIKVIEAIANRVFPRLERARAEETLRASEQKYRTLFESMDEGFCILQVLFDENGAAADFRFLETNPAFERQTGLAKVKGRTVRELVTGVDRFWFDVLGGVALTGEPRRFLNHASSINRWLEGYGFRIGEAQDGKVAVLVNDITARKETEQALRDRERQQRMLAKVGELRARVPYRSELLKKIGKEVSEGFGVSRCGFSWVDRGQAQITVAEDHHGELPSLVGTYSIIRYGRFYEEEALARRVVAIDDAAADPRTAAAFAELFEPIKVRAHLAVPLIRETEWVASFWVSHHEPHPWTKGEIETLKLIAERVWAIVESNRATEALRAGEERFRSVLENMSEGLMLFDPEGNLIYQNPASLRIHGFDAPEEGRLGHEKVPVTWQAWDQNEQPIGFDEWPVSRVFRRERFQDQVMRVVRVETGKEFYGSYNGSPIIGSDGQVVLGFITIRDITEQIRAQMASQKTERRLRSFFDSEMMGAIYWNMDGQITGANDKFLRMVGYSRDEVLGGGVSWEQMTPPEYRAQDEHALHELKTTGVDTAYEKEYIRKDGTRVPILIGAAMLDEKRHDGVAFVLDITQRKRAEKAALELQRKLDAALLAGEVGTFEWRIAEDRLWGDRNFSRVFGLNLDRDGSAPLAKYIEAIHPDDRPDVLERIRRTVETACVYEAEYRIVRGENTRWVAVRGMGERDKSGAVARFSGVLMDITERKRVEEALRLSEQQFRALAESIPQLVWTARPDGQVDYVNERWCEYTGQRREDALAGRWINAIHPEDRAQTAERWEQASTSGELFETEYRLRGNLGDYRWFLARGVALRDGSGTLTRWFGTTTDIDEHKRLVEELQQSQQQLRQAKDELDEANAELEHKVQDRTARLRDSVAELEHFSYTITHDMRAPLRAMQAFGQILRDEHSAQLDKAGADYLRRIVEAAGRMDALIIDSLSYAKAVQTELALEPLDPGKVVRGIVESYPQFQSPAAVIELAPRFPAVLANPAGLTQCISNLLGNAVKFVLPGTVPRVRVWGEERGDFVRLWFEDNGIGIPPEQHERVFSMFQRLNRKYEGTGIGLALVRKVTEKMRGRVGLESREGGGSRFWVELLRAEPHNGEAQRQ